MESWFELDSAGLLTLGKSMERDCQEAVKWERRKLEWIFGRAAATVHSDENAIIGDPLGRIARAGSRD